MDIRPQLQLQLKRYIDKKHSQAEVNGFIDGFEMACDLVDSCGGKNEIESTSPHLPLGGVSGSCPCGVEYVETKKSDIPYDTDGDVYYTDIMIYHCPKCGNINRIEEY